MSYTHRIKVEAESRRINRGRRQPYPTVHIIGNELASRILILQRTHTNHGAECSSMHPSIRGATILSIVL